ncbi:DUF2853 family protein [Notoacmeibacter ruber]|uniref:DUF2853 family protein n=2 Tax=Notoacmeibacter ruber TaxID=2670375 RepID=A0A3L7JEZ6_9HYPH|nr:DUF2853 family protein [Notoacmeibacter ruber]
MSSLQPEKGGLMAKYAEHLKKYDKDADMAVLEAIEKRYASVLARRETRTVACSQKSERETVAKNWAQEKLGVSYEEGLKAVEAMCAMMKGNRAKNRAVFYYLVAKKLDKLDAIRDM